MDKKRSVFFIWDGIPQICFGLADGHLTNHAVIRLPEVLQQLHRTCQRIDIDLPAECRQAAWEFRAHC